MSVEKWREEHYRVDAGEFAATHTQEECLDHCIEKWSGLEPAELDKFWLKRRGSTICDEHVHDFTFCGGNCALCYKSKTICGGSSICGSCIIKQTTGESCSAAWNNFMDYDDLRPMQLLLAKTKSLLELKKSKQEEVVFDHVKRHKELHKALDELVADWLGHPGKPLSDGTVIELMDWSHGQTVNLDEKK